MTKTAKQLPVDFTLLFQNRTAAITPDEVMKADRAISAYIQEHGTQEITSADGQQRLLIYYGDRPGWRCVTPEHFAAEPKAH